MSEQKAEKREFVSKLAPEVLAIMAEEAPLNWDKCNAIAVKFGLKPRTIQTSASRLGIPYQVKEKATKTGEKVVSKAELINQIAEKFDRDSADLAGLEKSTKQALVSLLG